MRRRTAKFLALLWLGWYLSGPLAQFVDSWDSPQEEIGDIVRSAGGAVTLLAGVVCFGIALFRRWRERCLCLAATVRRLCVPLSFEASGFRLLTPSPISHAPPPPLRI
jgi:hypothetical protein